MQEKILYYLGAGASVQALPLAKSRMGETDTFEKSGLLAPIPYDPPVPRIKGLIWELDNLLGNKELDRYKNTPHWGIILNLCKECKQIATNAGKFGDVDTYAKYLYIKNPFSEDFKRLKTTLSKFFELKQTLLSVRDSRYLPWFVTIMDERKFPENVKVLSWNYDFQLELAATYLLRLDYKNDDHTYFPGEFKYFPNLETYKGDLNDMSLIHLNGVAGFGGDNNDKRDSCFHRNGEDKIFEFLENDKISRFFHFAWETHGYHKNLTNSINKMIEDVTIMVVIGYSFPFFNRNVDKQIFRELLSIPDQLRKIYYQDPVLDGKQLIAQFALPKGIDIVHIQQTENFHVPFEY